MSGPSCIMLAIIASSLLNLSGGKTYNYAYNVNDEISGSQFEHAESSDGDVVSGKYKVMLPDGRLQIVSYIADGNGYRPTIQYIDGATRDTGLSPLGLTRGEFVPESDRAAAVEPKPPQCTSLPSPGECRGAFPRFFYNSTSSQCDCFLYGGCDDEEPTNSWLTMEDCSATCRPDKVEPGPRCKDVTKPDVQTFKQPEIVQTLDTSDLSDSELLDLFS